MPGALPSCYVTASYALARIPVGSGVLKFGVKTTGTPLMATYLHQVFSATKLLLLGVTVAASDDRILDADSAGN